MRRDGLCCFSLFVLLLIGSAKFVSADIFIQEEMRSGRGETITRTMWIGRNCARVDTEDGKSTRTIIIYPEKDRYYQLDHSNKSNWWTTKEGLLKSDGTFRDIKVTDSGMMKKIKNWFCRKYIIEARSDSIYTEKLEAWAMEEIKIDPSLYAMVHFSYPRVPGGGLLDGPQLNECLKELQKIKGIIVSVKREEGTSYWESEVTEIIQQAPPAGIYEIPSSYTDMVALAISAPKKETAEAAAISEGSPAYQLARELSRIIPSLAPKSGTVLIETEGFYVTSDEVIQATHDNLGARTAQLKTIDAAQLKNIIEQAAIQLAERKLLLAAAAAAKTVVLAEEVEKAMQSQYAQAGGELALREALKKAGNSIDYVKKSVRETLVINKLLLGITQGQTKVTEEDLKKAYQREAVGDKTASVRHILLMTQGKTEAEKAEARKKIDDLLARAKAGEDFEALAKQYSEDPGVKENNGLYEDFPRGQMVKPFEEAAFSVPVGQFSGVVETAYGYHILQVVGRKKETRPFEEVRSEIESRLKDAKQGTTVPDYIKGLKEKAKFKIVPLR
jgi:parvulin-like peptidyl-prolyl isomerase